MLLWSTDRGVGRDRPMGSPVSKSVASKSPATRGESGSANSKTRQAAATDRSLLARQGAHTLHSRYDSRELTKAGRAKFLDRFVREVDPNGELPEPERLRRAEHAKRAYFTGLARKSAAARSLRRGGS